MGAVEAEGSGEKAPSVAVIGAVLVALLAPVVVVFLALSEIGSGPDLFNFVYETKDGPLTQVEQCDVLLVPGFLLLYLCFLTDAPSALWLIGVYIMEAALFFSVGEGPLGSFGEGPLLVTALQIPLCIGVVKYFCKNTSNETFYQCVMYCALVVGFGTIVVFAGWVMSGDNDWFTARNRLPELLKPVQESRAADYKLSETWSDLDFGKGEPFVGHCPLNIMTTDTLSIRNSTNVVTQIYFGDDQDDYDEDAVADLRKWCKKVSGIAFYIWGAPLAIALCMMVVAMGAGLLRVLSPQSQESEGEVQSPKSTKVKKVERIVRLLIMMATALFVFAYLASYLAGGATTALATVQLFLGVAFAISAFFLMKSLPADAKKVASESKPVKNLVGLEKNNLVRALLSVMLFVPFMLLLPISWKKQRIRECMNPDVPKARFSPVPQRILNAVRKWHVGALMTWHIYLAGIAFAMDIIGKLTYVLLSMLGDGIADFPVGLVSIILCFVGFLVFMNPAMPGPVVYVTVGLVVTRKICDDAKESQDDDCPEQSFVLSLLLCTTLCFVTKLAAVCGQMEIGRNLGMKVSIQKMIGVEKPGIRAIELILQKPGLFPGKVAILCGGPDWPTSVLCGILKQSKLQMCIGTSPMFFVCFPSVLSGAIMNPVGGVWAQLRELAVLGLIFSQTAIALTGVYYITGYTASSNPEIQKILNDPREEHAAVEELSRKSHAIEESYKYHTQWSTMTFMQRNLLRVAWLGMLVTAGAVNQRSSFFFRPFSASSRVDDPYDKDPPGLNGKPYSLVRTTLPESSDPLYQGYIVIAAHYFFFMLFYIWGKIVSRAARDNITAINGLSKADTEYVESNKADTSAPEPEATGAAPNMGSAEGQVLLAAASAAAVAEV